MTRQHLCRIVDGNHVEWEVNAEGPSQAAAIFGAMLSVGRRAVEVRDPEGTLFVFDLDVDVVKDVRVRWMRS
jgi:hypothetical protein